LQESNTPWEKDQKIVWELKKKPKKRLHAGYIQGDPGEKGGNRWEEKKKVPTGGMLLEGFYGRIKGADNSIKRLRRRSSRKGNVSLPTWKKKRLRLGEKISPPSRRSER